MLILGHFKMHDSVFIFQHFCTSICSLGNSSNFFFKKKKWHLLCKCGANRSQVSDLPVEKAERGLSVDAYFCPIMLPEF